MIAFLSILYTFTGTNDYEFYDNWYPMDDLCLPMDLEIIEDDIALEGNETFNISATIGMWFARFTNNYSRSQSAWWHHLAPFGPMRSDKQAC